MATETHRTGSRAWTVLWILLIGAFLLVSLAWPARADRLTAKATRTDTFGAAAGVRSLSVDGVNGDVEVAPGTAFAATVEVTVKADSEAKAKEVLAQTKISFENRGGEVSLATLEPGAKLSRDGRGSRLRVSSGNGRRWQVEARYRVTLPPGATLDVAVVNGGVVTKGLDGVQELSTVNGRVAAFEARRDVTLKSVNGGVEGTLVALPRGAKVQAETVNGGVRLTLPADAAFDLKASAINGGIRSTFPFPVSAVGAEDEDAVRRIEESARAEADRARAAADRARERAERSREKADRGREEAVREREATKVRDEEWDREWRAFGREMAEFGRQMSHLSREISRSVSGSMNRSYEGSLKGGGASVRCSTVNGGILVLAAGTDEPAASSLVPKRADRWARSHVAPVPPVPPVPPIPPVPPVHVGHGFSHDAESIVKGDVAGDFNASLPTGDVRLGNVSGSVTVRTSSGDVKVVSAGKGADLSSSGGDVRIDRVGGSLTASSLGGDVVVGDVSGEAKLRTMGGDIRLRSAKGAVTAKTAGGDVRLQRVSGPVRAETAGGEVYCEVVAKDAGAVDLSTAGGDVTLVLPANFRGDVEVSVHDVDAEGDYVVSEFPEISVLRHRSPGTSFVRAGGKLNGGGPKVTVSAASGTVHLRKGPPA